MIPKIELYKEIFRFENQISILHSEFFVTGSFKQGDLLIVSDSKSWNSFINKEKEIECLATGLDLFSSKNKYQKYAKTFRDYLANTAPPIILKYKETQKLKKSELKKLFQDLSLFWYLYCFTEHSFHDLAYKVMLKDKNKILQKNLSDLGQLKLTARETLNAYMFKGGVIPNILDSLSKQFLKNDEANFLFSFELLDLFLGKKVGKEVIDNRKKCYALAVNNGRLHEYSYPDSVKILTTFVKDNQGDKAKGIIANKGKIIGKAVIAPMFNDLLEVRKIIPKMNQGDILVAQTTSPEYMALCKLAGAIVTDQGGMLSHAAIVSRELGIPCIVGTKTATKIFKDGDMLEVDANFGVVKKI
jgi:phosphohistidine swiveling domain-containing protein